MKSILLISQAIAFILAVAFTTPAAGLGESTVVLLHVLFRHGQRTPDKDNLYANDPYNSQTYFPTGYSQLTLKGKKKELDLGRFIRSNYGNLIPTQYTPDVAYAVSTNWKRTKMSLELVLSGLFPPLTSDIFDTGLNWQPISFQTEYGKGLINIATTYSPNYINQYYKYVLSKEAQQIRAQYSDIFAKLSELSGNYIQLPSDAANLYFTLKCEEELGLSLPAWTQGYYPTVLEQAGSIDYEYATATSTLTKKSAGFLLKRILKDTFAKINGTLSSERKIFIYSAHEWNIGTMLRALNVFYRHIPPFGAALFFEIHNVSGVYGLKLYYQNYETGSPFLLTIPGCNSLCPLDQLITLVQNSIPDDDDDDDENDNCSPKEDT